MSIFKPFVSVIMPALNEEKYIDAALNALEETDYPKDKIEIIVVDNGSDDRTVEIVRKRNLMLLEEPGKTIGEIRNIGAEKAKGDILAFLDSDCIVNIKWLNNALHYFADKTIGAVGCHTRIPDKATWIERVLDFHATIEGIKDVEYLPTANLIVRRDVFESVGGFDRTLVTGEDSDICHKIRNKTFRLISDTSIHVIHLDYPKTIKQLFKKQEWYSVELFSLLKANNFKFEYVMAICIPLLYAICIILFFVLISLSFIKFNVFYILLSISILLAVPALLSFRKAMEKKNWRNLLFSSMFYSIVCLSRVNTFIKLIFKKLF